VLGGAGSVLGVIVGGLLTSGPGWRWIFFVNVPAGALVVLLVPLLAPALRSASGARSLDLPGGLLVTAGTAAILYGLVGAGTNGWRAAGTIVALSAGTLLYLAFALVERTVPVPLMPLRVLRRRNVLAGVLLMLVATGLLVGGLFLASFDLQRARGYTALGTGLAFLPVAVGTVLGAFAAAHLATRLDRRILAGVALAQAGVGFAGAAGWRTPVGLIAGLAVAAVGIGAALVTAMTTALAGVDQHEAGVRSGIVNTFHELGGALGVAALSAAAAASLTGATPASAGFTRGLSIAAVAGLVGGVLAALVVPAGVAESATPHGH
jgi:MFS family permease